MRWRFARFYQQRDHSRDITHAIARFRCRGWWIPTLAFRDNRGDRSRHVIRGVPLLANGDLNGMSKVTFDVVWVEPQDAVGKATFFEDDHLWVSNCRFWR